VQGYVGEVVSERVKFSEEIIYSEREREDWSIKIAWKKWLIKGA
jgi:hypothetical protein